MANLVYSSRCTNMNIQTCLHEHWIIEKSPLHLLWPLSSCSGFNKEHAVYAGNLRKATSFYAPSGLWSFYPLHALYRRLLTAIPTRLSRRMPFIQEDALMQWKIHIVDEISDLSSRFLPYFHTIHFLSFIVICFAFKSVFLRPLLQTYWKPLKRDHQCCTHFLNSVARGFPWLRKLISPSLLVVISQFFCIPVHAVCLFHRETTFSNCVTKCILFHNETRPGAYHLRLLIDTPN